MICVLAVPNMSRDFTVILYHHVTLQRIEIGVDDANRPVNCSNLTTFKMAVI
jgi:hypothetical protein